jgi:hypothetical protein
MALEQGKVSMGNKMYLVHVTITTNSLTVEWLRFVHLINLNIPTKFVLNPILSDLAHKMC